MGNHLRSTFWFLLVAAFGLFGCDGGGTKAKPKAGGEVTTGTAGRTPGKGDAVWIGVAAPFTGDSSEYGVQFRMGVLLGRDEVNTSGGIDGRMVELQEVDDMGQPAEAQNVATKLATNPKIMAVIGHFNSSCSLAGKPAYTQAKMVMLSPGSTNVTVTQDSDYIYRNIFTDDFQGQSIATYAARILGVKRVAILYDNDDYGTGLKDSFCRRAQELNLEVVQLSPYLRDSNDFRSQLETVRSSNPDLILVAGLYKAAGVIAKQAHELGIKTPLIGGDGLFSQQYITLGGDATEGTLITCPFLFELGGERAKKFAENFRTKWNREPDFWSALGYDAFLIIVDGLKKRGISREAVLEHLKSLNSPETSFEGLTGRTFFDAEGDSRKPVQVAVVKDGKFVAAEKQLSAEDAGAATTTTTKAADIKTSGAQ